MTYMTHVHLVKCVQSTQSIHTHCPYHTIITIAIIASWPVCDTWDDSRFESARRTNSSVKCSSAPLATRSVWRPRSSHREAADVYLTLPNQISVGDVRICSWCCVHCVLELLSRNSLPSNSFERVCYVVLRCSTLFLNVLIQRLYTAKEYSLGRVDVSEPDSWFQDSPPLLPTKESPTRHLPHSCKSSGGLRQVDVNLPRLDCLRIVKLTNSNTLQQVFNMLPVQHAVVPDTSQKLCITKVYWPVNESFALA